MSLVHVRLPAVLLLVASALVLCVAPAVAAKRTVPRGFYGTMYDGRVKEAPVEVQDAQFAQMARAGVESVRTVFVWQLAQPRPGDDYDWGRTDELVELAAAHGMSVLPVVLYAPPWARVYPRRLYSPPRSSAYTAFLRAAIARYGPRGSFWSERPELPRRPVREWQIWNEPNLKVFWNASRRSRYGWPQGYATLLRAAHGAIKRADPGARTVTGGIVGLAWLELRRLYHFRIRGAFEAVAVHVYPQSEPRVAEAVRRVREELGRAGESRRRIYLTEMSFPASRGRARPIKGQRQETPRGMARRLASVYRLLGRRRGRLGLDRVYWYTWSSGYRNPRTNFEYSGLMRLGAGFTFTPQPALAAYRNSARRAEGCAKDEAGDCR